MQLIKRNFSTDEIFQVLKFEKAFRILASLVKQYLFGHLEVSSDTRDHAVFKYIKSLNTFYADMCNNSQYYYITYRCMWAYVLIVL